MENTDEDNTRKDTFESAYEEFVRQMEKEDPDTSALEDDFQNMVKHGEKALEEARAK